MGEADKGGSSGALVMTCEEAGVAKGTKRVYMLVSTW